MKYLINCLVRAFLAFYFVFMAYGIRVPLGDFNQSEQSISTNESAAVCLDDSHVALLPGLELVQHLREAGLAVHVVDLVLVELADLLNGFVIIRVYEEKILGKEDVGNVASLCNKDRDPGVSLVLYLRDCLKIEFGLDGKHVTVF